jgi:phage terminase small subunit
MALTAKQEIFANEYLIDLNVTRAYKSAYKVKNDNVAAVNGQRLLRNAKVLAFVSERQKKLSERLEITQEMVLDGYRKLAFYDARKFWDSNGNLRSIPDLDNETAFALAGFEVMEEKGGDGKGTQIVLGYTKKIKMSDRKSALDSICRVLGYNSPEKVANTNTKGEDIPPEKPYSKTELIEILKAANA